MFCAPPSLALPLSPPHPLLCARCVPRISFLSKLSIRTPTLRAALSSPLVSSPPIPPLLSSPFAAAAQGRYFCLISSHSPVQRPATRGRKAPPLVPSRRA